MSLLLGLSVDIVRKSSHRQKRSPYPVPLCVVRDTHPVHPCTAYCTIKFQTLIQPLSNVMIGQFLGSFDLVCFDFQTSAIFSIDILPEHDEHSTSSGRKLLNTEKIIFHHPKGPASHVDGLD